MGNRSNIFLINTSHIVDGARAVVSNIDYTNQPDDMLVEQIKKGNKYAFRSIVERYQSKVIGVAYGITHNQDDAQDVAQDVFLKIYRSLDKFRGDSKFFTWVYRITVNISIDFMRKKKKKQAVQYNDEVKMKTERDSLPKAKRALPREKLAAKEIYQHLKQAIEKLSKDQKTAFVLREMENLSYKEIADIMHCSVGTVMSRLYYARRRMRELLTPYL